MLGNQEGGDHMARKKTFDNLLALSSLTVLTVKETSVRKSS
jgi:hypothetical protein